MAWVELPSRRARFRRQVDDAWCCFGLHARSGDHRLREGWQDLIADAPVSTTELGLPIGFSQRLPLRNCKCKEGDQRRKLAGSDDGIAAVEAAPERRWTGVALCCERIVVEVGAAREPQVLRSIEERYNSLACECSGQIVAARIKADRRLLLGRDDAWFWIRRRARRRECILEAAAIVASCTPLSAGMSA
jgi:hypothetical protein